MPVATKIATVLTSTFGAESQDVRYTAIVKAGSEKYRVSIHVNSYDFQSHARVDVLHTSGWLQIINLHHAEWRSEVHNPIAGGKVTLEARKQQLVTLAHELVKDAARVYTA